MFKKEFKDFLQSDEVVFDLGDNNIVEKKRLNENITALYYYEHDVKNFRKSINLEFLCIVDNDANILYTNRPYNIMHLKKYMTTPETLDSNSFSFVEAQEELREEIMKYFLDNKDSYLDEHMQEASCEAARELYVNNDTPYFRISVDMPATLDNINEFYFNKTEFFNGLREKIIADYEDKFKTYINLKTKLEEIEEDAQTNDNEKFKDRILDILSGRYKTLKIIYNGVNGKEFEMSFTKENNNYRIRQHKKNVFIEGRLNHVPVLSIKKILWSRSCLLDAGEFNIKYPKKQMEDDFIKLNNFYDIFPESYYEDKDFIKKMLERSFSNLKFVSKNLSSDKDFIKFCSSIDSVDERLLLDFMDNSLKVDFDFVFDILKNLESVSRYYKDSILNLFPVSCFEDMRFIKFFNDGGYDNLISKVPVSMIKNEEFLEYFKDHKFDIIPEKFLALDLKDIIKVFSPKIVTKYLPKINWKTLDRDELFDFLIANKTDVNILVKKNEFGESVFDYFKYDKHRQYELAKCVNNGFDLKEFLYNIDIDEDDFNDEILPFCSYNLLFMHALKDDEYKKIFLEGEFDSICNVSRDPDGSIIFECNFTEIVVYHDNIFLRIKGDKDNDFLLSIFKIDEDKYDVNTTAFNYISNFLLENTEMSPLKSFNELYPACAKYLEKQKSKEKTKNDDLEL